MTIPVDPRKLARKASYFKVEYRKGKIAVPTVVSVPEQEEGEPLEGAGKAVIESTTRHTEIQYHLLKLAEVRHGTPDFGYFHRLAGGK